MQPSLPLALKAHKRNRSRTQIWSVVAALGMLGGLYMVVSVNLMAFRYRGAAAADDQGGEGLFAGGMPLPSDMEEHGAARSSGGYKNRHMLVGQLQAASPVASTEQQQWQAFWGSDAAAELQTLQALRDQLIHLRLQRLVKDVEPQDTAGLDLALAETLKQLAQQTGLLEVQGWVKSQLTAAVFGALDRLQHPADCAAARKLVCDFHKACGFGCQLHHAVHCLAHAVALNRTLVLQVHDWRYAPGQDGQVAWEALMAPVGSCNTQHLQQQQGWPQIAPGTMHEGQQEVLVPIIDAGTTAYDPPAMPPDVLALAGLFSSKPEVWWVGVLASYLLRPSAASTKKLADFKQQQGWQAPIVGVHVRRTDKVTSGEAKLHDVSSYMQQVELYCDLHLGSGWQARLAAQSEQPAEQQQRPEQQQQDDVAEAAGRGMSRAVWPQQPQEARCGVYLATDEPAVVADVRSRYKHIRVLTNPDGLDTGTLAARSKPEGAAGVYEDILLLAATDVLVGTFSSQVSRVAYEVALVNGSTPDASLDYHTVDSTWYFGGMQQYELCATKDYTSQGKPEIRAGQKVVVASVIPEYKGGLLQCSIPGAGSNNVQQRVVLVPPGILARCPPSSSWAGTGIPRMLPEFMQPPASLARSSAPPPPHAGHHGEAAWPPGDVQPAAAAGVPAAQRGDQIQATYEDPEGYAAAEAGKQDPEEAGRQEEEARRSPGASAGAATEAAAGDGGGTSEAAAAGPAPATHVADSSPAVPADSSLQAATAAYQAAEDAIEDQAGGRDSRRTLQQSSQ